MKWLAAILMVTNVAIFLWFSGRHGGQDAPTVDARPDVNREGMILLQELKPEAVIATQGDGLATAVFDAGEVATVTVDAAGNETVSGGDQRILVESAVATGNDVVTSPESLETTGIVVDSTKATTAAPESVNIQLTTPASESTAAIAQPVIETNNVVVQESTVSDLSCYRIGPFKQLDTWQTENNWMQQAGLPFDPVSTESRELRAVRVFLGPFQSKQAASPTVQALKETELDHFVYEVEGGRARISLGYFTQEELAGKFVSHVQSQGFQAQAQPEYRILGPYNWMEARIESVRRGELLTRDWSEEEVGVLEVDCKET